MPYSPSVMFKWVLRDPEPRAPWLHVSIGADAGPERALISESTHLGVQGPRGSEGRRKHYLSGVLQIKKKMSLRVIESGEIRNKRIGELDY